MKPGLFVCWRLVFAFCCVAMFTFSRGASAELTIETSDKPGELYFLWQGTMTDSGAKSHRLSGTSAFSKAYSDLIIDSIEILEVRELDTDQELRFSYVMPKRAKGSRTLQDVVWYYPNPIPSGGRVRVQVRGRMVAPKVYKQSDSEVNIDYKSSDGVFVIIPIGFALTYCNSPIIVYEKNSRTVASFSRSAISLVAKNVKSLEESGKPPAISRENRTKPSQSRLPIEVSPVRDPVVLKAAEQRFRGGNPVLYVSTDREELSNHDKLHQGATLIYAIDNVVIDGVDGFSYIAAHSVIGSEVTLKVAEVDERGRVRKTGFVKVPVLKADK